MDKSRELLPHIIGADTEDKAIEALIKVTEALHLSQNYYFLVELKDSMNVYKAKYRDLTERYRQIPTPRHYHQLHDLRMELTFLARDFADEFAFEINKAKIFHEERKTEARAIGILELKEDKEFQGKMKATSASALRDMVGASGTYQEYISLAAVSYGLYQEFHKVGDSMKLFNDSLASECREAQHLEHKDAK